VIGRSPLTCSQLSAVKQFEHVASLCEQVVILDVQLLVRKVMLPLADRGKNTPLLMIAFPNTAAALGHQGASGMSAICRVSPSYKFAWVTIPMKNTAYVRRFRAWMSRPNNYVQLRGTSGAQKRFFVQGK
jgi:hypothetical protein